MIIPFGELKSREFALSNINTILQNPKYRELHSKGRICNGFIYVISGSCRYSFSGGEFSLAEGGIAYLPRGSHHTLTVTSENIIFYRIDFTLRIDGELAYFSDRPIKLTDEVHARCAEAIASLSNDYGVGENTVVKNEKLCTVFSSLHSLSESAARKRLMPAVRYLQECTVNNINCGSLAELCFLSTSRFYDLFRAEFGMTPLEYRNEILLRRAKTLLSAGEMSVGEVAFAVGFENAAYFSRFFKKHVGFSPSEYTKGIMTYRE